MEQQHYFSGQSRAFSGDLAAPVGSQGLLGLATAGVLQSFVECKQDVVALGLRSRTREANSRYCILLTRQINVEFYSTICELMVFQRFIGLTVTSATIHKTFRAGDQSRFHFSLRFYLASAA